MASSQAAPAYSNTDTTADPANPITAPKPYNEPNISNLPPGAKVIQGTVITKAPTTKDIEENRWTGAAPGTRGNEDGLGAVAGGSGVIRHHDHDGETTTGTTTHTTNPITKLKEKFGSGSAEVGERDTTGSVLR